MAPTSDLGDFDDSECVISPRLGLNNNGDMHLSDIETFLEHYGACRLETWRPDECILQMASQASPVIQRDRTGHVSGQTLRPQADAVARIYQSGLNLSREL